MAHLPNRFEILHSAGQCSVAVVHNERDSVSTHRRLDCLLNHLFRRKSKKTSKLRVTGFVRGNHRCPVDSPHKGPVTRKVLPFDDVIRSYIAAVPVSHHSISKITQTFVKFINPQITNSFHKHLNGHWNMNWIGVVYMVCFSFKTKSYINQCHDSAENRSMQKRRACLSQNLICKSVTQEYSLTNR